mmetsp:Transcript_6023/g.14593  ORF Transcript_6023/g.14593 Transcript_6023/m.14593 type:complete len:247 (+) Transcript_6023:650-1390(+)
MVRLSTKLPSQTSTWIQSAPAARAARTSAARLAASAASVDAETIGAVGRALKCSTERPSGAGGVPGAAATPPRNVGASAGYSDLYTSSRRRYSRWRSGSGSTTRSTATIAATAEPTSGKAPAAVAARIAQPRAGASAFLVRRKGRLDTSAWICSHRGERVTPPAMVIEDGEKPAARCASRTSSVPKHTASMRARKMCARVCFSVRPTSAPRESGSVCGVRLPWKWSSATRPSHPGGSASAARLSSS